MRDRDDGQAVYATDGLPDIIKDLIVRLDDGETQHDSRA